MSGYNPGMAETQSKFNCIAIIGVGLIGGSVALAARRWGAADRVIGYGRNQDRLAAAQKAGVIDGAVTSLAELDSADLVIVCTPVDRIAGDVLQVLSEVNRPEQIITDVGSVKHQILQEIELSSPGANFVGSHPLAGSHHTGFEHASPDLFQGRRCVLTPTTDRLNDPATLRVREFWERIGMQVNVMPSDLHDQILASTSHLPHLAASVVAGIVSPEHLEFAATGYRDTTRVAAGDPELWAAIMTMNAPAMVEGIDQMISLFSRYRDLIAAGRQRDLVPLLEEARGRRLRYRDDALHLDDGS